MNQKIKFLGLLIILLFLILMVTACGSTRIEQIFYNLELEVAGEGAILDDEDKIITFSEKRLDISRNSLVDIRAVSSIDSEFLFWTGDVDNIFEANQTIYMDRSKEVLSVFGDPDNIFMAGYIIESWGSLNVVGYWKALVESPHLEIYVRETGSSERAERYIFDKGDQEGRIIYYQPKDEDEQPDLANSEYIAALIRIEESNIIYGGEATRYLFVYSDRKGFDALILEDDPSTWEIYDYIYDLDKDEFVEEINRLIYENRDKEIIIGNTVNIFEF